MNYNSVIQAEFGMTFAPLDPQYDSFPIACIPATSGKATIEFLSEVETIITKLREMVNIIGLGTDGDNTYSKYANEFMDNICANFEAFLELNPVEIIQAFTVIIHFSDPFHLTKRDRYRKASHEDFFIIPNDLDKTKSYLDLEAIGIPPYILDDNKARKMEDQLPKKLFNLQTIHKIVEIEDLELLISMLPSSLLLESIHRKELDCQDTIDYLLFGSSIVMIYYLMQKHVIDNKLPIYENNKEEYRKKMCFTEDWCKQYIFTTIGIASCIITEQCLDTGACSSHYQEHSFANIRRHSKQDNSHMRFMKSMRYILLEHELCNKLSIDQSTPESRCDSGRTIISDGKIEIRPIHWYLKCAKRLWRNLTTFPRKSLLSMIKDSRKKMTVDEFCQLFKNVAVNIPSKISTKSTGMIKTAGLNNMTFWNAQMQLDDLVDDEDEDE